MTAIAASMESGEVDVPSFDELYAAQVGFVWRLLRTCGVPADQVEDAAQDVFVIVHRRLGDFEGRSSLRTWLFSITRRVAARHRDRHRRLQTTPPPTALSRTPAPSSPFEDIARQQAASVIAEVLDGMDDDKRLVFALVEIEQVSVAEVARMLRINLNTAHSRLRLARAAFTVAIRRKALK
jgi:RNA polymerase sigma-70 factor, ECF subfamily